MKFSDRTKDFYPKFDETIKDIAKIKVSYPLKHNRSQKNRTQKWMTKIANKIKSNKPWK